MLPVRAIVLAAGQGKRMKSNKPKVLHEVLGRAILSRVMDAVGAAAGFTEDSKGLEHLHLVVGHSAEVVTDFVNNNPPPCPFSTHLQSPQLGTGHAVMQVMPALEGFEGTLIVTVGDAPVLQANTLAELLATHRQKKAVITALSTVVPDPKNYGRMVRDQEGKVRGIVEDKDASAGEKLINEVNTGIYCIEWPAAAAGLNSLSCDNKQKEYYLTDLVAWAYHAKLITETMILTDFREVCGINSRVELAEATVHLRDITASRLALESGVTIVDPSATWIAPEVSIGEETLILPGCYLVGNIEIGSNCQIGPFTVIKGVVKIGNNTTVNNSQVNNSVIGDGVKIGPYAHVREGNVIGDSSKVGNFVELKKAEIGHHSNVSHLSYVGDAVLGNHVNIGAGTLTANYDHLTKKKQRTIINDGASTGCNSVLVAPVELGVEAVVGAGSVVTKAVPDGALAVARAKQANVEGWSAKRKAGALAKS
ncbi:bifunctional UDP-N-acetylglucosamine diphosphorylase/glucosamine-1-phosphate N-acetyltransferase GlmU [bacterium]|nr:bifunctional UDP-N-acetylglucosamine diphosphorylase/glucosamine-1-phosphate N-acetyltransferase GlmU [bacterium]